MFSDVRLPLQEDGAKSGWGRAGRGRKLVDEGVGHSVVENTTGYAIFLEHQKRQAQPEENAGFQVIPRRRQGRGVMDGRLRRSARLHQTIGNSELFESQDESA